MPRRPTLLLTAALLLAAAPVAAQPPGPEKLQVIPAPAPYTWDSLKVAGGQPVTLSAGTAKKAVWVLVDAGADLTPEPVSGATATFRADRPGEYRVIVLPADGPPILTRLQVGNAPPGPDPKPNPPNPPGPDDPLTAKLRKAYTDDPGDPAAKRAAAKDLAELYRQAADLARRPTVETSGQLLEIVRSVAANLNLPAELKGVRTVVAGELLTVFPDDVPLTDANRKAAADTFLKLAAALDTF